MKHRKILFSPLALFSNKGGVALRTIEFLQTSCSATFVYVNRNRHFSVKPLPSTYQSFDRWSRKRNHARLTLQIPAVEIGRAKTELTENSQVNSSSPTRRSKLISFLYKSILYARLISLLRVNLLIFNARPSELLSLRTRGLSLINTSHLLPARQGRRYRFNVNSVTPISWCSTIIRAIVRSTCSTVAALDGR